MGRRYIGIRTAEGKTCPICKRFLLFDKFGKSASERDSLTWSCKDCTKARDHQRYSEGHGAKILADRKTLKQQYINKMGGCCIRCGYNEFVSGLDFHHLEDKEHGISDLISIACQPGAHKRHLAKLEQELAKCVLVCRNCHGGLHAGEWSLAEPTYTRREVFVPEIKPFTNETDDLPLFSL